MHGTAGDRRRFLHRHNVAAAMGKTWEPKRGILHALGPLTLDEVLVRYTGQLLVHLQAAIRGRQDVVLWHKARQP